MAKRQRTRPGQRRPAARPARPARPAAPAPARPLGALTAAEESRAAELEAEILAQERAAEATRTRSAERRRTDAGGFAPRSREGSLLAARAGEEYAYVVRDARRIIRVGGSLVAILAVLFVLIDVLGVIKL
jgi:hypothetical protein